VWIAGGTAKEGGIDTLTEFFPRVAHAYLIGRDAPMLAATLTRNGVAFTNVGTLEAAVSASAGYAATHRVDVVLLSPACASWDQFTGFPQRGDRFRALAQQLSGEGG